MRLQKVRQIVLGNLHLETHLCFHTNIPKVDLWQGTNMSDSVNVQTDFPEQQDEYVTVEEIFLTLCAHRSLDIPLLYGQQPRNL